jgi:hypothetical protein
MVDSHSLLRAFGRLLPRQFRDRVFEPALADLELELRLSTTPRWKKSLAVAILIGESLRIGVPYFVWQRGRPTRFGAALLASILIATLLVQRISYAHHLAALPGRLD